jgi:hypothetical protein
MRCTMAVSLRPEGAIDATRSVTSKVIGADVRAAATVAQLSSGGPQDCGVFVSPRRSQRARSRSISCSISFGLGRATK